jgi:DNA-binding Xre family transcriptional regulator
MRAGDIMLSTMAITWKLKPFLDSNSITPYRLSKESGLAMSTIYSLSNDQPERLDMNTLDAIMSTLERLTGKGVKFDDLLERN